MTLRILHVMMRGGSITGNIQRYDINNDINNIAHDIESIAHDVGKKY